MRILSRTLHILALGFLASACVTVNIYFPAAKVERTADEIVDDVYKRESGSAGEQSSLSTILGAFLGPNAAYAQEQATSVSNSAIRGLKNQIEQRHEQLLSFYRAGNVGINKNGYLEVVSTEGVALQKVAQLKRLVAADNEDRKRLYLEVAQALNIEKDQVDRVEKIFASKWKEKASGGWLIQTDGGEWKKK